MEANIDIKPIEKWKIYKGRPLMIAGPCSAESETQLMDTAVELAKSGKVDVFRAGIWKPRTRPGTFEGVGKEGLKWLKRVKQETGLLTATEVATSHHVNEALKFGVDLLWIGARTTANPFAIQDIADSLSGVDTTVLIKNPLNPDLELWLGALERINKSGIEEIGLIHRGFSTYEKTLYRNQPMWQVPIEIKRRYPNVPMICDPSHIGGSRELIQEISQKALDLSYDGLIIESHINPECALSDKDQQITPATFINIVEKLVLRSNLLSDNKSHEILKDLRYQIDLYDDQILDLLEQRMKIAEEIGKLKRDSKLTILQSSRWDEIMKKMTAKGSTKGLSNEFINSIFMSIHQESINHQNAVMNRYQKPSKI